jgi:hypothetical protein
MTKRNSRFIVLRDIQDHAISGDLSLFELGVYSVIHFQTDFSSGVWMGSAARVHATAPRGSSLRDVQRAMEHLEELRFLRSFRIHGQRGNAPYLVHKYEPLTGALKGKRLNAFASDDWRHPVYESCTLTNAERDALTDALGDTYSVFSTQKAEGSTKTSAPKPASPDPRFRPFFDFAYESYRAKHDRAPLWRGKDRCQLQALLREQNPEALPIDRLKLLWQHFISSTDAFIQKQGDSLAYFCSNLDKFSDGPLFDLPRKENTDGKATLSDRLRVTIETQRAAERAAESKFPA